MENKIFELYQLDKIRIEKSGKNYIFITSNGKSFNFTGDIDSLSKYLRQIQAKDSMSCPRSKRKLTYKQMATKIDDDKDEMNHIYCWKHLLNKQDLQSYIV